MAFFGGENSASNVTLIAKRPIKIHRRKLAVPADDQFSEDRYRLNLSQEMGRWVRTVLFYLQQHLLSRFFPTKPEITWSKWCPDSLSNLVFQGHINLLRRRVGEDHIADVFCIILIVRKKAGEVKISVTMLKHKSVDANFAWKKPMIRNIYINDKEEQQLHRNRSIPGSI